MSPSRGTGDDEIRQVNNTAPMLKQLGNNKMPQKVNEEMSTSYPSYKSLLTANTSPQASPDLLRLHWNLNSDNVSDSIFVLDGPTNAESKGEPYSSTYQICESASHCPPVSSIIISVENLDEYADQWIEAHGLHADSNAFDEDCGPPCFDSEDVVQRCCGENRPGEGPRLEIVAEPGHFITVGQYVNEVHPWLRQLKGQLRGAASVWAGWGPQEDPEMIVRLYAMPISVDDTRGWTPGWAAFERETQAKIVCSTYGHSQLKTGHPVRSAIHKQLNGRLVLRWVTTWESLLL
ncbi:hypothetical protein KCU65_g10185, partial [Aureobasidium melanogenum]